MLKTKNEVDALNSPSLFKLLRILDASRDNVGSIELQTLQCLLQIATRPGLHQHDLVHLLDLAPSSVSRNISLMSETFKPGVPGYGYVITREDPMNRRHRIVNLTAKGRQFVERLVEIMED